MKKYPCFLLIYLFSGFCSGLFAQFDFTTVITPPRCANTRTGKIEVIPTGVVGPFTITLIKGSHSIGPPERLVTSLGAFTFDSLWAGPYKVLVSSNDQGGQIAMKNITVDDTPRFSGFVYGLDSSCALCDVNMTADFQPEGDFSFLWSTNQTTPKILDLCDGLYTLTVTQISTGCQQQYERTAVNILPYIYINTPDQICLNKPDNFSFNVARSNSGPCLIVGPADSLVWDFGDGTTSIEHSPNHTYTSTGSYTIQLSVNGAVYGNREISVSSLSFSFAGFGNCVSEKEIEFYPEISCGPDSSLSWDFGDPNSSSNTSSLMYPNHTFSSFGKFVVTLSVDSQIFTDTVFIDEDPNATAEIEVTTGSCTPNPYRRRFSCYLNCGQSFRWNFGDPGSGSENVSTIMFPDHNFSGPGTYLVTLSTDSGSIYGVTKTLLVVVDNPVTLTSTPDQFLLSMGQTVSIGEAIETGFEYVWKHGQNASPLQVGWPGMYILTKQDLTNPNTCVAVDTILVSYSGQFTLEASKSSLSEGISLYPNPVSDQLYFSGGLVGNFQILNALGQCVRFGNLSENKEGIQTSGLFNGLYIFRWRSDHGSSGSLKFLVEGK